MVLVTNKPKVAKLGQLAKLGHFTACLGLACIAYVLCAHSICTVCT